MVKILCLKRINCFENTIHNLMHKTNKLYDRGESFFQATFGLPAYIVLRPDVKVCPG